MIEGVKIWTPKWLSKSLTKPVVPEMTVWSTEKEPMVPEITMWSI